MINSLFNDIMRKHFLIASLVLLLAACKSGSDNIAVKKTDLDSLFARYTREYLELNPLMATVLGEEGYNSRLPIDIGLAHRQNLQAFSRKYREKLAGLDLAGISADDSLNVALLNWDLDQLERSLTFPDHYLPVNQFQSLPVLLPLFASGQGPQPFNSLKDHKDWLERVGSFPEWADTAIANMRRAVPEGWMLPRSIVEKTLPQLKNLAETATDQHIFFMPAGKISQDSSIRASQKDSLKNVYRKMVEELVKPAYARLHKFMQEEYLPAARNSSGIGDLPGGKEYYAYLVRLYTTTNMKPDEIFDLGQREVARIRAEMEAVKEQVGFKGTLKEFFKHVMETEPRLRPYKDANEVLANFNRIHEKIKPAVALQFDLMPRSAFEVRRTEAFREASASAEYMPGSPEQNRPGVFYVPVPDARKYNVFQDESLFLHEAIPGHHFQGSLQLEAKNQAPFRKFSFYGAYIEGWGLYAESLGKELGLYTDPYQYFGRLGAEMHRALRLVVDVGLHHKGWTREQAIAYDLENEAESEANVIAEVERYMVIPGQALSYKVGEQSILGLKKRVQKALGGQFNAKEFHNLVLSTGPLPLELLSKRIDRYLASKGISAGK